jgi:hypothetical protein
MKKLIAASALVATLCLPAFADGNKNGWNNPNNPHYSGGSGNTVHGAPGPIAGAGLPIIAVGYGVYWLVRRRRRINLFADGRSTMSSRRSGFS